MSFANQLYLTELGSSFIGGSIFTNLVLILVKFIIGTIFFARLASKTRKFCRIGTDLIYFGNVSKFAYLTIKSKFIGQEEHQADHISNQLYCCTASHIEITQVGMIPKVRDTLEVSCLSGTFLLQSLKIEPGLKSRIIY